MTATARRGVTGRVAARADHWRRGTFGPASEEPYRRRLSDWVRVASAAVLLALLVLHHDDVTNTEQAVFEFFNTLPDELQTLFEGLYSIGAMWALGLVVVAALVARRWRLARDLAISGVAAWLIARVMGELIVADKSVSAAFDAVARLDQTPSFPLVRLAVIVAVVSAASPYVTRPTRRIGHLLVVLVALSAMYLGTGFPNDVLAGLVLGWGVAAVVHLAFGSPGGRPTAAQVADALTELGVVARGVQLAPVQPEGSNLFLAEDDDGPLEVRVIGRDEADARFLAKLTRAIVYKDSGPALFLTRLQDVEHQGYVQLLAQSGGAPVPHVIVAGTAGPEAALLVIRPVHGPRLADLEPKKVTDKLLKSTWRAVAELHAERIAHGALDASSVVVGPDGPVLVRFELSSTAAPRERRAADVAELLASTATIVGDERAARAARAGIGAASLGEALPFLQPAAVSRTTERALGGGKRKGAAKRLDALRAAGARAANVDEPVLVELHRVSPTNLMMAIGTLIAVVVLLGQVGDPADIWDTLQNADWWLVVLALILSISTNIPYAIALMGCIPRRLPLWPTTEVQVAMSFSNLAIPAVGGLAVQIRYLQKQGVDLASAVAAGGLLSTVANVVAQIVLFVIALALSPATFDVGKIDTAQIVDVVLLAILVAGVAVALILGVARLRKMIVPPVRQAMGTIWEAVRSPRRLGLLLFGNFTVSIVYGFTLLACIEAYGGSVDFWSLLAANIGISTIASLVPVPGGNTAVSSIGLSGALVAFGVPEAVAVSAILTNQLVVSYVPALPGWWATRDLLTRGYI